MMLKGVAGEVSQHIHNMVAMQKTTLTGKSKKTRQVEERLQ
jgi:hypothetical protein